MENYKRITDDEVFKVLEDLKNEDEQALAKAIEALLLLELDIRHFLRKIYKNTPKKARNIVTDPLKAGKNDIVIGNSKSNEKKVK